MRAAERIEYPVAHELRSRDQNLHTIQKIQ